MNKSLFIFFIFSFVVVAFAAVSTASSAAISAINYNPTEATRAWYFCKLNSCDPNQIMNGFTCPACNKIQQLYGETLTDAAVFYHEKAEAHGYVAYSEKRNQIIVSFRGTRTIQWFYDFDFNMTNFPGCPAENCKVHQGFLEIYQVMQANVSAHVSTLLGKYPTAKIAVSGHSLGAATSVVATIDLINRMKAPVEELINFGCPRVFNYEGSVWAGNLLEAQVASGIMKRHQRLVWANDPVPKVAFLEMGFWHLPSEVWYPQNVTNAQVANPANYVLCKDGVGFEALQNCSFEIPVQKTDPSMHGWYMGIEHGCF